MAQTSTPIGAGGRGTARHRFAPGQRAKTRTRNGRAGSVRLMKQSQAREGKMTFIGIYLLTGLVVLIVAENELGEPLSRLQVMLLWPIVVADWLTSWR
jgi:hypothetical protein